MKPGIPLDRREFLLSSGLALALPAFSAVPVTDAAGWDAVPGILSRIRPPLFPDRDFAITRYGARDDGRTDCTDAIAGAVAACHQAGGGRVLVPAGAFLTGPIHLRSGVNLHLDQDAQLRFVTDPRRYLPVVLTRWEGVECMNYSPLVYAFGQENIAVTGPGVLDGQADHEHWWPWCGSPLFGARAGAPQQAPARRELFRMGEEDVPVARRVFGEGGWLRPGFLQFYRCRNVLLEGVTVRRAPMWQVHPVLCTNVTVRGVSMVSHGPNNDGCNPESSRDVRIEECHFDTGDDCIAVKSGRNRDGRRVAVPSERIVVRRCRMKEGHGGVTIGSEASGGVRGVYAERCSMDSPNLERALRLKTNSVRGGFIEHVYMRDVTVGQVSDAVLRIDLFYEEGDAGRFPPRVRHIEMRNVTSRKSRYALYLRGYAHTPLEDIRVVGCSFGGVALPDVIENVKGLRIE